MKHGIKQKRCPFVPRHPSQVMIEEKVKVVETAGRNPEKVIKQCKAGPNNTALANNCVIRAGRWHVRDPQVRSSEARTDGTEDGQRPQITRRGRYTLASLETRGADMISMDGFDCGGHPGGRLRH